MGEITLPAPDPIAVAIGVVKSDDLVGFTGPRQTFSGTEVPRCFTIQCEVEAHHCCIQNRSTLGNTDTGIGNVDALNDTTGNADMGRVRCT